MSDTFTVAMEFMAEIDKILNTVLCDKCKRDLTKALEEHYKVKYHV